MAAPPGAETPFEYRGRAGAVALAGSWDGWAPQAMARVGGEDAWVLRVPLPPGRVRFKFVVDGAWVASGGYEVEDDGHGGENCVREVGAGEGGAKEGGSEAEEGVGGEGGEEEERTEEKGAEEEGGCVVM